MRFPLLNWFQTPVRRNYRELTQTASLEQKSLLSGGVTASGIKYSVVANPVTTLPTNFQILGTPAADDISVGLNGAGHFVIYEPGVATDTGCSALELGITDVDLRGLGGDDELCLYESLGTVMRGRVNGGDGNDVIRALNNAKNSLRGGMDDDIILDGFGNSVLNGEAGNDQLNGRGGNDSLYGGIGNDVLNGGTGNDRLFGGAGADVLRGNAGDDMLYANDAANTDDLNRDRLFGGGNPGDQFFSLNGPAPTGDQFIL